MVNNFPKATRLINVRVGIEGQLCSLFKAYTERAAKESSSMC